MVHSFHHNTRLLCMAIRQKVWFSLKKRFPRRVTIHIRLQLTFLGYLRKYVIISKPVSWYRYDQQYCKT